jgi:CRP-like cAMP-binding protein
MAVELAVDTRNELLKHLGPSAHDRLRESLEDVELSFKQVLYEPDADVEYVYFVERGVVSLVTVFADGSVVETGTIGNEGIVGLTALLGGEKSPDRAICQIAGRAKRVPAGVLRNELGHPGPLVRFVLRYTDATIKLLAQTAACNRRHPVEERLSRWLLMTFDRVGEPHFALTQEFMAQMLGVRRPAVNIAGAALQRAGLIRYTRGKITIENRQGLEAVACECYGRIRDEFKKLFEET